jgi:hypothetical protein
MGRRLYETMLYWETADRDPSLDEDALEWAAVWKPLPKVVFSSALLAVEGNARLATGSLVEEIERLRAEPTDGEIAIGGAALAGEAARLSRARRPGSRGRGGPAGADRRIPASRPTGARRRWYPVLSAIRAPGGS